MGSDGVTRPAPALLTQGRHFEVKARKPAESLAYPLGSYEQLESERKFAEAAYQHALLRLDQARADADRQHIYIASFVPPMLPEEALYPRRWRSLGIVALVAFALWGIGGLIIQSVRDHLCDRRRERRLTHVCVPHSHGERSGTVGPP